MKTLSVNYTRSGVPVGDEDAREVALAIVEKAKESGTPLTANVSNELVLYGFRVAVAQGKCANLEVRFYENGEYRCTIDVDGRMNGMICPSVSQMDLLFELLLDAKGVER